MARQTARQIAGGNTVEFTERKTGQVRFTHEEFLTLIQQQAEGIPDGAKITGVDISNGKLTSQTTVTVRMLWEPPRDLKAEFETLAREIDDAIASLVSLDKKFDTTDEDRKTAAEAVKQAHKRLCDEYDSLGRPHEHFMFVIGEALPRARAAIERYAPDSDRWVPGL